MAKSQFSSVIIWVKGGMITSTAAPWSENDLIDGLMQETGIQIGSDYPISKKQIGTLRKLGVTVNES